MPVNSSDPHAQAQLYAAGATLEEANSAVIALHGRGADAADIINLAGEVVPPGVVILAPNAVGQTWYPYRFIEPIERNEPYLSSALDLVGKLVSHLAESGIPAERVALLGFSQGACLALEYAARHAQRYGAVVAFSGGLIGPPGTVFSYPGSLAGTPVFLGCSDVDAHIPVGRVEESAQAMAALGAAVDLRIYPGLGHTVNGDEIQAVRAMLAPLGTGA
ncbi:MAG: dienelactone hydrolase family protein [Thermomicrobiales bacterium]|nr:dienelactone hydrolase family protein [Thermomicrobiales bacterium]